MPSKSTPIRLSTNNDASSLLGTISASEISINKKIIHHAYDAVNSASLGLEFVEKLRHILVGIAAVSGGNEVVHGMAEVGVYLANDFHNMLDANHEEMNDKVSELEQGGNHA